MWFRQSNFWLACAALFVTAVLSACGGGDSATSADPPRSAPGIVSRQQFIDRSKAVCRKWRERISQGFLDLYDKRTAETKEPEGSVGSVESVRVIVIPGMRQQLREMEEVGLPKGDAYAAEMFWEAIRRMINEIAVEGNFAWGRPSTIFPVQRWGKQFRLQNCIYF